MPKFNDMQTTTLAGGGNFQFSAIRPDKLGATEYTLVTIVVDISWSVDGFKKALLACIKSIIQGCQRSPRADNLMVRLLTFNDNRQEVHGFVPLNQIDPNSYPELQCSGSTALYDACYDAIGATNTYGKTLFDQDFGVNAAVYIITDGEDNRSTVTPKMIAKQVYDISKDEFLESMITVLVGVNTGNSTASGYLQIFQTEAGLNQFVEIDAATPDKLAKLAAFVDKSIRSQSQALGTGSASQLLTF
ncbi:von Willebrand factor type A-like protein [Beggiatoa alba B18LD]|uniref:von Willebrand factor type A-like protein n=1 Tax=Beggiatoa alba B18LD TaxID=395493 RepID=I3CIN6_9GAMM|nr:vWA domain-containing protein [Beggiatoa alba]EIJ43479.1 von Willebrand factor type A-like protein [Beggiatoa alba B18LD]